MLFLELGLSGVMYFYFMYKTAEIVQQVQQAERMYETWEQEKKTWAKETAKTQAVRKRLLAREKLLKKAQAEMMEATQAQSAAALSSLMVPEKESSGTKYDAT